MKKLFWEVYSFFYDSILILIPYKEMFKKICHISDCSGKKIIDLGCGTGNLLATLTIQKRKPAEYFGIDGSVVMIFISKIKNIFSLEKKAFLNADLDRNIEVDNSYFDIAYSVNSMYALADPDKFLKNIYDILKFGGELILVNPKERPQIFPVLKENYKMFWQASIKEKYINFLILIAGILPFFVVLFLNFFVIKRMGKNNIYHFFNEDELALLLEGNGFRIISMENIYGDTDIMVRAVKIKKYSHRNKNFIISKAVTEEDLQNFYKLRFQIYCHDIKSLLPEDYPECMEIDKYDKYSESFIILFNNDIIGGVRLIKDSEFGFLMEEEYLLPKKIERERMLEASRVMLKNNFRKLGLFSEVCEVAKLWSRENGYRFWCLACQGNLAKTLVGSGWKIKFIGKLKKYHNTYSVPLIRYL